MHNKSNILNQFNVVLCRTSHGGNIGSSARAMKTMGLSNLYLVQPKHFPSDDAYALAAGADDILDKAIIVGSLEDAIKDSHIAIGFTARRRELSQPHKNIRESAQNLIAIAEDQKISLVFGNETNGLSNDEIKHCQLLSFIDANKSYSSLNLAQAVQICCHELRVALDLSKDNAINRGIRNDFVPHSELNGFFIHLESMLNDIGFLRKIQGERLMQRLRLLFNRTQLDQDEVNIMRGIFTEIQKKIK
ncbi:MAG: RNA methyltransferase [Nitrosomonadales bacterium]|nr:RNA methyltransferase [Nitrosomonadales bacterium]MBT6141133.1 RNA methyltransferase [Nitrosomonadales bacterium]